MDVQHCPDCGHANPREARFCMNCGHSLDAVVAVRPTGEDVPVYAAEARGSPELSRGGTDWAAIVAAMLAVFSLKHMSRKARQTTVVLVVLLLFFGCPMFCGFIAFVMEWIARLFQ